MNHKYYTQPSGASTPDQLVQKYLEFTMIVLDEPVCSLNGLLLGQISFLVPLLFPQDLESARN